MLHCYTPPLPIDHRSMLHCYTSSCQLTIDPCYTVTPHKSAQGICALCYMWNLCGVVVIHGSMVNWREGDNSASRSAKFGVVVCKASLLKWGSICHRSMPHHYTSPLPIDHRSMLHCYTSTCQLTIDPCYTITPHKSAQGICALCYMWNLCGVLVFHGSMVNWRRGGISLSWNLCSVVVFHGSMVITVTPNLAGRSTGRSIPHQLSIDALNTITPNLAGKSNPHQLSIDALNTITPNLAGRSTGRSTPCQLSIDALNTITPNLASRSMPHQSSIDALDTVTPNLADLLEEEVFYAKDLLPAKVSI